MMDGSQQLRASIGWVSVFARVEHREGRGGIYAREHWGGAGLCGCVIGTRGSPRTWGMEAQRGSRTA